MTVYVLTATEYHGEGETLTEVFAHREDAIARLHDLYIQACADPEITEQEWHGDDMDCCPCCSWFDYRSSYQSTYAWVMEREVQ